MDIWKWNQEIVDKGFIDTLPDVITQFVWESDPYEKYEPSILLNRNQLLGLLLCRDKYLLQNLVNGAGNRDSLQVDSRLNIVNKSVDSMTLQELKDTVVNIQLEWPVFLEKIYSLNLFQKVEGVRLLIAQCMQRFGVLCSETHAEGVLNDSQDTCECQGETDQRQLTLSAIRRMLGAFLLLLRHLDLWDMSEEPEIQAGTLQPVPVSKYHHEASMDHFHKLHMHYSLPVAAKMQYKHDFPGMYNDVSQAVYFHNADYSKVARETFDSTTPLHMLPSVCLLYPEIPIKFEDDHINPFECKEWYWLLVPNRVYLITPESRVFYSNDLSKLLHVYLNYSKNKTTSSSS